MPEADSHRRYTANLQGEVDSAALYAALAEAETDPKLGAGLSPARSGRGGACRVLAAASSARSAQRRAAAAPEVAHASAGLARAALRPVVRAADDRHRSKQRDIGTYDRQPEAVAGGLPAAERSHARVIEAWRRLRRPRFGGPPWRRLEGRHRGRGGNALRAAVLGANDGLVSNLSLVMGVAGAEHRARTTILAHRPRRPGRRRLLDGASASGCRSTARASSTQRQIDTEASELEQLARGGKGGAGR